MGKKIYTVEGHQSYPPMVGTLFTLAILLFC